MGDEKERLQGYFGHFYNGLIRNRNLKTQLPNVIGELSVRTTLGWIENEFNRFIVTIVNFLP